MLVYLIAAGSCVLAAGCVLAMRPQPAADAARAGDGRGQAATVETVLEGLRFVVRTQVLLDLVAWSTAQPWRLSAVIPSPIRGAEGNVEFLTLWRRGT